MLAHEHPILHGVLILLIHRLRGNQPAHFGPTPLGA